MSKKWQAQNKQRTSLGDAMIEIHDIRNHQLMNFGQGSLIEDFCRIFASPFCTQNCSVDAWREKG